MRVLGRAVMAGEMKMRGANPNIQSHFSGQSKSRANHPLYSGVSIGPQIGDESARNYQRDAASKESARVSVEVVDAQRDEPRTDPGSEGKYGEQRAIHGTVMGQSEV